MLHSTAFAPVKADIGGNINVSGGMCGGVSAVVKLRDTHVGGMSS